MLFSVRELVIFLLQELRKPLREGSVPDRFEIRFTFIALRLIKRNVNHQTAIGDFAKERKRRGYSITFWNN